MRRGALLAIVLVWVATDASAQATYQLAEGELVDQATGASETLSGFLVGTIPAPGPGSGIELARELGDELGTTIRIDDFRLEAGDRLFDPAGPPVFDGLPPVLRLRLADQIQIKGDRVALALLNLGGEVVSRNDDEVTLRSHSLEARDGRAVGRTGESGLPRRLEIAGTLEQIDQTFRIVSGCGVPPIHDPPGPIEGTLGGSHLEISAGSNVEISAASVTLQAIPGVEEPTPGGSALVTVAGPNHERTLALPRPSSSPAAAEATTVVEASPVPAPVTSAAAAPPPTLEALGITAPAGATVVFEGGRLTVETDGDLLVEGRFVDLPGLLSLSLFAQGDVVVSGVLELPAGVVVTLRAGGVVDIEGEVLADAVSIDAEPVAPVAPVAPPGPVVVCVPFTGLVPIAREERSLATFSFVASAARPVAIDVKPRRRSNRVDPARRQVLTVALLADAGLDLDAVVRSSLRLGDGEAKPWGHPWFPWVFAVDANRDGRRDLLAFFDSTEAGIAYGDERLCLTAETVDGELLEGCDAIDTRPRPRLRRRLLPLLGRR